MEGEKTFNYRGSRLYSRLNAEQYKLKVTPSIYVKKLGYYNTLIDANLLFTFNDGIFSSGLSYELGDEGTFGFLIGTKFTNFNLYYSYDFAFKEFQTYNNGSHELTVGYQIGK
ncbi:MAG: type IX secretion system membrane protein PorP/SprF [Saprospiraceae bacterium]